MHLSKVPMWLLSNSSSANNLIENFRKLPDSTRLNRATMLYFLRRYKCTKPIGGYHVIMPDETQVSVGELQQVQAMFLKCSDWYQYRPNHIDTNALLRSCQVWMADTYEHQPCCSLLHRVTSLDLASLYLQAIVAKDSLSSSVKRRLESIANRIELGGLANPVSDRITASTLIHYYADSAKTHCRTIRHVAALADVVYDELVASINSQKLMWAINGEDERGSLNYEVV